MSASGGPWGHFELLPAAQPPEVTEEVLDAGLLSSSIFRNLTGLGPYAYSAYGHILRHPGGLSFTDLLAATGWARSTVAKHLKALSDLGLVTKQDGLWVPGPKEPQDVVRDLPLAEEAKQRRLVDHRVEWEQFTRLKEQRQSRERTQYAWRGRGHRA